MPKQLHFPKNKNASAQTGVFFRFVLFAVCEPMSGLNIQSADGLHPYQTYARSLAMLLKGELAICAIPVKPLRMYLKTIHVYFASQFVLIYSLCGVKI